MSITSTRRTVVVTGASTGIGRACALELDRLGFHVFAGVRSDEAGRKLQAEASERLTPLRLDVTNAAEIAAAVEKVEKALACLSRHTEQISNGVPLHGTSSAERNPPPGHCLFQTAPHGPQTCGATSGNTGLAGLVNNAGIAAPGPVELVPIEAWRRQIEVNVLGQVAVTQAFLPLLRRGRGRIVYMSSVSGGLSVPYLGAYCASKFALEAIADSLRVELHPFGIKVSAIEPGPIDTPIWTKAAEANTELASGAAAERLSLYEDALVSSRKISEQSARDALPVERVVRAVVHALTARRPKTRYFIGRGTRFCFKWSRAVPDRLRDWIIRKALGMKEKGLGIGD
jgi:NAD(P)-dependent dehydrogenase (short-subunit alcohol dehydrogenase family)